MLLVILSLILLAISADGASVPASANSAAISAAARANNEFGFELQTQLIKDGVKNTFFSPINIGTALSMVYLGAKGRTAAEMEDVLRFQYIRETDSNNSLVVHQAYKSLLDQYNQPNKSFTLFTANNIYPAKNFALNSNYSNNIEKFYNVSPVSLDYRNPVSAAKTINKFVEDNTNNKIKDLFDPSFPAETKLVLVSAIYFKGTWKTKFEKSKTIKDYDFRQLNGEIKKVDMMQLNKVKIPYMYEENLGIKMIELPYNGEEISMFIILPDANDGLNKDLLSSLTAENFNKLKKRLFPVKVEQVKLPKFKLETKYPALQNELRNMNLRKLFSSGADLSGIGDDNLVVSQIVHQAFVQVDEEGTEAAAATGITVMLLSGGGPPKLTFVADHSFTFFLYHKKSNIILFQGIITEPLPVEK